MKNIKYFNLHEIVSKSRVSIPQSPLQCKMVVGVRLPIMPLFSSKVLIEH